MLEIADDQPEVLQVPVEGPGESARGHREVTQPLHAGGLPDWMLRLVDAWSPASEVVDLGLLPGNSGKGVLAVHYRYLDTVGVM